MGCENQCLRSDSVRARRRAGRRSAAIRIEAVATGLDPCSLVTKQEAATAVGESVSDGKSTVVDTKDSAGLEAGGSCAFDAPSSTHYLKVNM